jgi:hypothetical protein
MPICEIGFGDHRFIRNIDPFVVYGERRLYRTISDGPL